MKRPILVTGAAGFVGQHLLRHLPHDHDVVGSGRSAAPPDAGHAAPWLQLDLLDREGVRGAIRTLRPTAIYHCAGLPHVAQSWTDWTQPLASHVLATHHLLDAVRRNGLGCRVLVPGSATVYAASPDPIDENAALAPASPYALSKLAQEELALLAGRDDGIEVIATRSFNHTGPGQTQAFVAPSMARQIALIEAGALPPVIQVGNLDAVRDITDVRDVVKAYVALMRAGAPATVYNVASGVGRPMRSILDALVARSTVPLRVETDPARLRPNDIAVLIGDSTRLRRTTGWAPEVPFEQTMDDLLTYWRAAVGVHHSPAP